MFNQFRRYFESTLIIWGFLIPTPLIAQKKKQGNLGKTLDTINQMAPQMMGAVTGNQSAQGPIPMVPGNRIFGQCLMPQTITAKPLCPTAELAQTPYPTLQAIQTAQARISHYQAGLQQLEALMTESTRRGHGAGLSCFRDRIEEIKSLKSQMKSGINDLKRRFNRMDAMLREELQKQGLDAVTLKNDNAELFGDGLRPEQQRRLLDRIFGNKNARACSAYIDKAKGLDMLKGGISGMTTQVQSDIAKLDGDAQAIVNNQHSRVEQNVRNSIQQAARSVSNPVTFDDFLEDGAGAFVGVNNASIMEGERFKNTVGNYMKNGPEINKLKRTKAQIERAVSTFSNQDDAREVASLIQQTEDVVAGGPEFFASADRWRNKKYKECFNQMGIDLENIFAANTVIDQTPRGLNSQNTSASVRLMNKAAELRQIFSNDQFDIDGNQVNSILSEIQEIAPNARMRSNIAGRGPMNPAQYFAAARGSCEKWMGSNASTSSNRSVNSILGKLREYRQQRLSSPGKIAAELTASLSRQLVTCEDTGFQLRKNSCSLDQLSPRSNEFCLANSIQCGSQIRSCREGLDQETKRLNTRLKNKFAVRNKTIRDWKRQQSQILQTKLSEMTTRLNNLARQYGFATNPIFANEKQMSLDFLNLDSEIGSFQTFDPKKNYAQSLLDNIDLIKTQGMDYIAELEQEAKTEYDKQKAVLTAEQKRYQDLMTQCQNALVQGIEQKSEITEELGDACMNMMTASFSPCEDLGKVFESFNILSMFGYDTGLDASKIDIVSRVCVDENAGAALKAIQAAEGQIVDNTGRSIAAIAYEEFKDNEYGDTSRVVTDTDNTEETRMTREYAEIEDEQLIDRLQRYVGSKVIKPIDINECRAITQGLGKELDFNQEKSNDPLGNIFGFGK